MRLLGCLGAIDHFYYKKVSDKVSAAFSDLQNSSTINQRNTINHLIVNSLNKNFNYFRKYKQALIEESAADLVKIRHVVTLP